MIEKYKRTKNANIPEDFEGLLIKEEARNRLHIALNNKLKLKNDSLKLKIKIFEEDKQKFEEKINKLKEEYENKINEMNKEIENLNIIKNDLENKEKKYIKKLELKYKENYKLQMKLNNLLKKGFKNNEKDNNQKLSEKKFKKNNSMDFGTKFRIKYSDYDLFQKNTNINNSMLMMHPYSARNLDNIYNKIDYKKLSNIFPEKNNLFNDINKTNKSNTSLIKNKNSIFNIFLGKDKTYKSQSVNGGALSVIRKIRKNFRFIDNAKYNSINDIKLEKEEIKNRENKILLFPRNNNNKMIRTFSAINKSEKNESFYDLFKNPTYNDDILKNTKQVNISANLINQIPNKNENQFSDINKKKKEFKLINKFRISSINKDGIKSNKEENNKQNIIQKKIFENKIIQREQNISNVTEDKYKGISINYNIPTN